MEVKPGYKQTEVGVIPKEWKSPTVRGLASSARNAIVGGPFGSDLVSRDYVEHGVPVIRGQNMSGQWVSGNFVFVTSAKAKSLEANLVRPGDIVFTQRGTLGQVSLVPEKPFGSYLVSQSQMKLSVNREVADPLFFFYVFTSEKQQELIREGTIQTGVPHINLGILRDIPVQLPPLPEQHAIAGALSDVDALIGALDQLIAKKRDLKQAAMQQLLTGQKRLPGFHGDWEVKKIGELLKYERPDNFFVKSDDYQDNAKTPVLTANKSFILGYMNEDFGIYDDLPVIIFDDFTTDSKYVDFPFKVKSSAIKILKSRSAETKLKFVYERMRLVDFPLGEHKRYYISEYQHVEIPTPKPAEQTAIAEVLSDMDAELAALTQRRDKTRAIKQGMMQELLTGRIRLV
jgi:type I restriction enzyme S subunit